MCSSPVMTKYPTKTSSHQTNRSTQKRTTGHQTSRSSKKEPRVIRPAAKDLKVRVKNTRAAARSRKNDMSEYMNMFIMFIENSLPRLIRIRHHTATFGEIWGTHLDKMICPEIIEFKEVSNCIINIWIKYGKS